MYTRKIFGSIKSLLHFDWPYAGTPNSGLYDECGICEWQKHGSANLANSNFPGAPKFGYRCAYTQSANDYYESVNSVFSSPVFDTEIFFCLKSSSSGNILALMAGDNLAVAAGITPSRTLILNSTDSQFELALDTWYHLRVTCSENIISSYIDGAFVVQCDYSAQNITAMRLGGCHALFTEFVFRTSLSNLSVPSAPYKGTLDIVKCGGFGDGHDGVLSIRNCNKKIVPLAIVSKISDYSFQRSSFFQNAILSTTLRTGDEIMFYVQEPGTPTAASDFSLSGLFAFRHVTEVNGRTFSIDTPIDEEFDAEKAFANYTVWALKVPNFSSVNIDGGKILCPEFIQIFRCKNDCYLGAGMSIYLFTQEGPRFFKRRMNCAIRI